MRLSRLLFVTLGVMCGAALVAQQAPPEPPPTQQAPAGAPGQGRGAGPRGGAPTPCRSSPDKSVPRG
jgi:hypothetical protein